MAEQRTLEAERVALMAAVRKLVKAKGRFHTEQNYMAVVAALDAHDVAAVTAPPALGEDGLPPIEYDQAMQRTYIPLPGGWEIQTKGTGSSFRIAHAQSRQRWIVMDDRLHEVLEAMARNVRNAFSAARQSAPEGAPVGVVPSVMRGLCDVIAWVETEDGLCQAVEKAVNIKNDDDAFVRLSTVKKLLVTAPMSASAQPADQNKMEKNDE